MSEKERQQLYAEFSILHSLKHPNIVRYYDKEHIRDSKDLHLYMEYCSGGDLGKTIKELKERRAFATEDYVWNIFSQIATALYRCHYGVDPPEADKSGIVHKPQGLSRSSQPFHLLLLKWIILVNQIEHGFRQGNCLGSGS